MTHWNIKCNLSLRMVVFSDELPFGRVLTNSTFIFNFLPIMVKWPFSARCGNVLIWITLRWCIA